MADIFIPPLDEILKLFGIKSKTHFISKILNSMPDELYAKHDIKRDSLIKSVQNYIKNQETPSNKITEKLKKIFSNKVSMHLDQSNFGFYWTEWEFIVKHVHEHQLIDKELFPCFQKKFTELVQNERILIEYSKQERLYIDPKEFQFFLSILTNEELNILNDNTEDISRKMKIKRSMQIKTLLYCIALIDAEYILANQDIYQENSSVIKTYLPRFETKNNKPIYVTSMELFFRKLIEKNSKTFKFIQDSLDSNGYKENLSTAQRIKLLWWRKGQRFASIHKVEKIIAKMYPDANQYQHFIYALVYKYTVILHNLVESLTKNSFFIVAKTEDAKNPDIRRKESVEWLTKTYDDFFEKAKEDIKVLKGQGT